MASTLFESFPATERSPHLVSPGWRVFFFYGAAALLTGFVTILFVDLLWRTGWSMSGTLLLGVFVVLFFLSAVGCLHGIFGFLVRRLGDQRRITLQVEYRSQSIAETRTALIFPIYNENVARVYEGLRATYESLQKTGQLERFDFFILSDSTDPDKWVQEERRWCDLLRELGAGGRIYYRRRLTNDGKKSGNVRDFLTTWGARYRYFIIFDADSVMRGETIVTLVKLMEARPTAGLIQTAPALVSATFWWFAPVLAGMVLSIPLSVLTSHSSWGKRARELGLLLTPEEISPPPELRSLRTRMAKLERAGETAPRPSGSGIAELILDPYTNAIHVSLLRAMRPHPGYARSLAELAARGWNGRVLGEKLLSDSPAKLQREEELFVLADPETVSWLHQQAWRRPAERLAAPLQVVLRQPADPDSSECPG